MNGQQEGRYSLKRLLEQYEVHIPQLQRDYAQGRKGKEDLRKAFVTHLYDTLKDGKRLNLDFVYGYTQNGVYYPLDGQQRLTTLWLLHWYLVPAEECEGAKEWLGKFCYQTRITATRFCKELVASIDKLRGKEIVNSLKDNMPWFRHAWEQEPTVAAMLEMLREIECQFGDADRSVFWKQLTSEVKEASITFDSIDIRAEEFRLTDELYIKMNARGKQLTPFESYKAHLTEVLHEVEGSIEYEGKSMSYEEYFSLRADNQWLDLFWTPNSLKNVDEVDKRMLYFYTTIARLCFFRQPQEDGKYIERPAQDFNDSQAYEIFRKEEHAQFLFDTLNLFHNMNTPKGIKGFFDDLSQGLKLFDNNDLFDEACKKDPDNRTQILLLFVVEYMLKYKLQGSNSVLQDHVRVLRNLLVRKREWKKSEITYKPDVRINRTGLYWQAWSHLLDKQNVYDALVLLLSDDKDIQHERRKAELVQKHPECKELLHRLEERPLLQGITDAFEVEDINQWATNLPQWVSAFEDIWKLRKTGKYYLIAQALIACGFKGRFIVGVNSNTSKARFMGKNEKWDILLTAPESEECHIAKPLQDLLTKYSNEVGEPSERLQKIIDVYWQNIDFPKRDWRYYFCKYPNILIDRAAYFAFSNAAPWDVRSLGRLNVRPTRAPHCNPYAYVVGKVVGNDKIITYLEGGDDNVALELRKSVSLRSVKEGWSLDWWDNAPIKKEDRDAIYAQFSIGANEHILRETPEKDRIEIAVEFCKAILALP